MLLLRTDEWWSQSCCAATQEHSRNASSWQKHWNGNKNSLHWFRSLIFFLKHCLESCLYQCLLSFIIYFVVFGISSFCPPDSDFKPVPAFLSLYRLAKQISLEYVPGCLWWRPLPHKHTHAIYADVCSCSTDENMDLTFCLYVHAGHLWCVFFLFAWDFPSEAVYFDDEDFCDVRFHILLTSYPTQHI